jgi:hypothetical protein
MGDEAPAGDDQAPPIEPRAFTSLRDRELELEERRAPVRVRQTVGSNTARRPPLSRARV